MTTPKFSAWGTAQEIAFLRALATRRRARALLEGYLRGAQRRTEWPHGLDRDKTIAFAQLQLIEATAS